MSLNQLQDFYKKTLTVACSAGATNIYVSTKPTVSNGYCVISPSNASLREIVRYTGTGTDGTGDYITIASAGDRGLGGTTAQTHIIGESIRMNVTSLHWADMITEMALKYGAGSIVPLPTLGSDVANKDYVDMASFLGSSPADTITLGIMRASYSSDVTLGTCTMTIASPAVITLNSHGLTVNDMVKFSTTVALPTGITAGVTYYVISAGLTANDFRVSTSYGGSAVNTSGSQSGVHTLIKKTPIAIVKTDTFYGVNNHATTTGSANAYILTLTNPPTALVKGQVYSFFANFSNTTACTVNINGLGAKTIKKLDGVTDLVSGDIANGMIVQLEYDGTNMIMLNPVANASVSSSQLKFGGTGADGALTISSGTTSIDLGGAQVFEKNYSSISITGTATLVFTNPHANGTTIILKCRGNFVNTSSAIGINASGMGASGGAGVATQNTAGNAGTSAISTAGVTQTGSGSAGGATGGGSQFGVRFISNGLVTRATTSLSLKNAILLIPGSGGGSGSVANGGSGTSGAGGRGGGALYIEIGGSMNFTGSISTAGLNGADGTGNSGSGGGGGSAGVFVMIYGTLVANSGTVTSTGGNGGTSVNNGYGNSGGGGAGSTGADGGGSTGGGSNGGNGSLGSGGGGTCNFGGTPRTGGTGGGNETNLITINNFFV